MARSASDVRTMPEATGDVSWLDVTDNWREVDAEWLQNRSVVRVDTTPDAETELLNTNIGRLFYSVGDGVLYLSTTGGSPFSRVLASPTLVVDESVAGIATLGVSGHKANGIHFDTADGSVSIGNLTITVGGITSLTIDDLSTGTLEVTAVGGITINTDGSHPVVLTTGVAGLLLDHGLDVNGTILATGATLTSLTVTGTANLNAVAASGTVTVGTAVVTPLLEAAASNDLTIAVRSGKSIHFTSPTLADANFFYGAGTSLRMAWVVVNNSDPGVANVPEGTIWIQP